MQRMNGSAEFSVSAPIRRVGFARLARVLAAVSLLLAGWRGACQAETRYVLHALPEVEGQTDALALGVNNAGQVVGYVRDAQGQSHAVRWDQAGVTRLAEPSAEASYSQAYRLNEAGQIVGKVRSENGDFHAALWENGSLTDLGTLHGSGSSFAMDINDQGVVAGFSDGDLGGHAITWSREQGFRDYGNTDPPHRLAMAGFNGINNNGLMVGTSYFLLSPFRAAFARQGDKSLSDLSPAGRQTLGMALAVNDAGTIVGYHGADGAAPQAAIFQESGRIDLLGTLGLEESWAQDVNQLGTIVGRAFSFGVGGQLIPKAFAYEEGTMYDLLERSNNAESWTLIEASGVNDRGVIVGSGLWDGKPRAFMAVPVPEPSTGLLLASGALGFVAWRRQAARRNNAPLTLALPR